MTFETTSIILAVLALAVGLGLGYLIRRLIADSRIRSAENKVQNILNDAKSKAQDLLLEAKKEIDEKLKTQITELEKISGLNRTEALTMMSKKLEAEYQDDLYAKIKKLEEGNKETVEKKAREIMTMAIQRYAGSHISD